MATSTRHGRSFGGFIRAESLVLGARTLNSNFTIAQTRDASRLNELAVSAGYQYAFACGRRLRCSGLLLPHKAAVFFKRFAFFSRQAGLTFLVNFLQDSIPFDLQLSIFCLRIVQF